MQLFFLVSLCALFLSTPLAWAQTYPSSDVPLILPRTLWENGPHLIDLLQWTPEDKDPFFQNEINPHSNENIPDYTPVERIVIHDTGCRITSPLCNSDTVDARAMIQSIYRNHAQNRGWGDIGYHYIIDRKGNIYEGRYGGNGVRGAHVYDTKLCRNFNTGTIGIVLLGNYANTPVPEAAFLSLVRLVGWLSATNDVAPDDMTRITPLWVNPKKNGTCDATFGGFSDHFTGPVVLGHNEIELKNTDPGVLDMHRLRREATTAKETYKGLYYQEKGDVASGHFFTLEGGVKKKVVSEIKKEDRVVAVNGTQLALFPEENKIVLPEGTLIKSNARNEIYKIEQGKRRQISSAKLFQQLQYTLANVHIISDRELLRYGKGSPLLFPEKTLLKSLKDDQTYLVTPGGKKRRILFPQAFHTYRLNKKAIITVPEEDIAFYPLDGVLGLPEGTLVSLSHKASVPNYMISDGGKKLIPSPDMFRRWRFNSKKIKILSQKDFALYPDKGALLLPNKTLIQESLSEKIYFVWEGKKYWITEYAVLKKLKVSVKSLVSLPTASFILYPEGDQITHIDDARAIMKNKPVEKKGIISTPPTEDKKGVGEAPLSPQTMVTETASSPTPLSTDKEPLMRIGLFTVLSHETLSVKGNGSFTLSREGKAAQSYPAEGVAQIQSNEKEKVMLHAIDPESIFTITSLHEENKDRTNRFNQFRGNLEIVFSPVSQKRWVVNVLPLEKYLAGVGEALNTDHEEYQKAFSIIARSYALFHFTHGGKYGEKEVFHLNNSSSDQVYKGYVWETIAPRLVTTTQMTKGKVMFYKGTVARALYSSDSGGISKNACTAFRGIFCTPTYDYLVGGIQDPEGTVRRTPDIIQASHGVGMSAAGARRLAALGSTYKDILLYYYKDVSIEDKLIP